MRGLRRNQVPLEYRVFLSTEDVRDDSGKLTGQKKLNYAPATPMSGSVSPAGSYVSRQMFGTSEDYEYAVVSHDMSLPIKEDDLIIYEGKPHVIRRIAHSLNVRAYAIRRVNINGA